ncbi:hypothetical protein FQA39_LY11940 [Lamprigera yunnana]|nr:hypothetical protein FQA39_LY11940 [Lamprigera yunnana]
MITINKNKIWEWKCEEIERYLGETRVSHAWRTIRNLRKDKKKTGGINLISGKEWVNHYRELLTYNREMFKGNIEEVNTNEKKTVEEVSIYFLLPLLGFAIAKPQNPESHAEILRNENENIGVGDYKFGFETSNGISRDEKGTFKNAGTENEAMEIQGQSSYTDNTGKKVSMTFVADENGYRPHFSISR